MNARAMMEGLALVAFELAEAESHERRAASHRLRAGKMLAAAHLEFKEALELAEVGKMMRQESGKVGA